MRTALLLASVTILTTGLVQAQTTDQEALRSTVSAIRDGGTVLVSWVMAQPVASTSPEDEAARDEFDWNACPGITLEEARRLVGVEQSAHLHQNDGWGHEIEYCLRADDPSASRYVVGLRSPGRDGEFDSDVYAPGSFEAAQPDHDVVWIDGMFVTWPRGGR